MQKLLIMADDFTGALDTGIQFAKKGISTQVACGDGLKALAHTESAQVLSVDMETRSMTAQEAYRRVRCLAEAAKERGIPHIYKKTDSALRGNVGAELLALADAAGEAVCFLPAYPDAGRTTEEGIHYVNGILLQDSAFGRDPFEPVKHSFVPDILKKGGRMKASCIPVGGRIPCEEADVFVLDAKTNQDIQDWAQVLKEQGRLRTLSGCAGFAAFLPEAIGFAKGKQQEFEKRGRLYVACGSVNPVTARQVDYAAAHGFAHVRLTPVQKLCPDYYDTEEGRKFLENIYETCINNRGIVVDTFDAIAGETKEYAREHGIEEKNIRRLVPACHGNILRYLMKKQIRQNYLLTGGDTLAGVLGLLPDYGLHPIEEASQGVAASFLMWEGRREQIFTKSGGFGEADVFVEKL